MADDKEQTGTVREIDLIDELENLSFDSTEKFGFTCAGPRVKCLRSKEGRVCKPIWYVFRVEKGSSAERKGLVPGDCILKIGDKNMEDASLEDVRRYFLLHQYTLKLVVISDSLFQPSQHQQLYNAAVDGDLEAVNNALEGGADVNVLMGLGGRSPLHFASRAGHLELVNKLIDAGAYVNLTDEEGWSPLYFASHEGHLEIVNKLIDAGGDVNLTDKEGWSPLHFASGAGHLEIVNKLIDAGGDVKLTDKEGISPLHFASYEGHLEIVNKLIDAGGDVNLTDKLKRTPLLEAAMNGHINVAKKLLKAGADPSLVDYEPFRSWIDYQFNSSTDEDGPAPDDARVPIEIMARGPEALRAYQKALKDGETHDRRVPVMIVGQDRSGKTSLKKSLKGEKFDLNENSTMGIEVDPTLCHLTTEVWRAGESVETPGVKIATEEKFDHAAAKLIWRILMEIQLQKETKDTGLHSDKRQSGTTGPLDTQKTQITSAPEFTDEIINLPRSSPVEASTLSEANQEKVFSLRESSPDEAFTLPQTGPGKVSTSLESNPQKDSSIPEEIIQRLLATKENEMEDDDDVELVLWDFAGQSVFYTTHVLFLSRIAIYILTYDLTQKLGDKAVPLVKRDMYERVLTDDKCETTNMDYIHYWLSSIHAFSSHSESPSSESKYLPPKIPPVFLVGTHADKCSRPREVAMEILSNLKDKDYEEHVVGKVFTVDNTRSGSEEGEDEEIKKLRPEVLETARELPHMKELVPVWWLRLEKFLKSLKAGGANFTNLGIVRKKAQALFDIEEENDFRTVIDFLHDRHAVLHFSKPPKLDELVVLDHQWLINVFKEVITVQPIECQERAFREHWEKLESEGVLRLELVEHVWKGLISSKETVARLLLMLEKFSLICQWIQPDGSKVYLVPSMLMSEADSEILDLISSAEIPALIVRFPDQYLPFGLFPRLVTRCVNWCSEEWSVREQPNFFKNYARFFLGTDGVYQVILSRGLNVIFLSVIRGEKVLEMRDADRLTHERSLATFCRAVLAFVKPALREMQEEHLWMKLMSYTLCFTCPVCSKDGVRVGVCRLHRAAGCTRDQCLHYVTEDELVHGRRTLVCCGSEDATNMTIPRKQFAPWYEELENKEDRTRASSAQDDKEKVNCPESDDSKERYTSGELLNAAFFDGARQVKLAIGYITSSDGVQGTGFAISKRLVLSCQHVLKHCQDGAAVHFNYGGPPAPNVPAKPEQVKTFHLQPGAFYYESVALDYAVIAMSNPDGEPEDSSNVTIISHVGKVARDLTRANINILSHPCGKPMMASFRRNPAVAYPPNMRFVGENIPPQEHIILHHADTDRGSSGAPMFNDSWQLVGIHQGVATEDRDDKKPPFYANYGRKITQILEDMYSQPGECLTEFEKQLKGRVDEFGLPFENCKCTKNFKDCCKDDQDSKCDTEADINKEKYSGDGITNPLEGASSNANGEAAAEPKPTFKEPKETDLTTEQEEEETDGKTQDMSQEEQARDSAEGTGLPTSSTNQSPEQTVKQMFL